MFSYISAAQRVPADHPLRRVREMADTALKALSREFDRPYSKVGRPSIAPERLLRALLLQYFYGIRSERLLMEQLDYNLLFRWFVGLSMDDEVWDASTFSKNRDRLLEGEIAERFLQALIDQHLPRDSRRTSTSASTALWSRPGRARRASSPRVSTRGKGQRAAILTSTSAARNERTTRTNRLRILMLGCIAKGMGRNPSSATWVTW
jgi:transposase